MKQIITHPGRAHKDDFLACCLLVAENEVPIFRRDPWPEDLDDAETCVVDVGHRHEPELLNFDHHHFPREQVPTCALSLVLQHLGLYEDGRAFLPWLECAEWLDARGPRQTAEWLEVDPFVVTQLSSPLDFALLRYFAEEVELQPNHAVWQLMRRIGADLLGYLRDLRSHLDTLDGQVAFWTIGPLEVCYLPRIEGMDVETANALDMYVRQQDRTISATVYPDKRSEGFGLCRFNDDMRLDFTQVENEDDVHFAHRQGFIAKTTATEVDRLQELLNQSLRP